MKTKAKLKAKPKYLTLQEVEKALGEPASKWACRCYEIACDIVGKGLVKGTPVYGHWLGPVHPDSPMYRGENIPFVRHGWIVLSDGSVLDPTRWVFEAVEPYLYYGPADDYDEGGNRWRKVVQESPPAWDPDERQFNITASVMSSQVWSFVERYLRIEYDREDQEPGRLCQSQLSYLANAPLEDLGEHAAGVYAALSTLHQEALIPLDNRRRVESGRWR